MSTTVALPAPPLFNWLAARGAGALLHPTSLPSDQGVGVLDSAVDAWLAFLSDAGIGHWQVCPLGPTGYGDSPYQCFSAFAGNPYLVDLRALVAAGLLADADLVSLRALPRDRVDYGGLYAAKWPALFRAHANWRAAGRRAPQPYGDFAKFRAEHAGWLNAYALFMALKDHFDGRPWWLWPESVRFYTRAQSAPLASEAAVVVRAEAYAFAQYLFFGQWAQVRAKARAAGVALIGDAPIFAARDSADVWSRPELFQLDQKTGAPLAVAGVPPDYFSADGQLWGNPLYDWPAHAADGYAWWLARLRANFALCDIVRIDHFRGFDTYWAIPATAPTARTGEWKQGPGLAFFRAVRDALPDARLIAEDLGDLLPSVLALRDATGLPGMTVLQFAFGGGADNLYLPHHHCANSVHYPGTHDNDTTLGWYRAADEKTRDHFRRYLRVSGAEAGWDAVRTAYASVSYLAVVPLQDFLSLGSAARFNTPGKPDGNWQWRCTAEQLGKLHRDSAPYLRELGTLHGRLPFVARAAG
jgi:4-alpha-glucanotransferase